MAPHERLPEILVVPREKTPTCREPARDIPLVTKVMRKGARHTQRRDRASGVPPDILEHLPPNNQSLPTLLLCALASDFTEGCPPPPSHSLCQRVNLQLQLITPGPDLTQIAVSLQSSNRRVRPRLVWRNGTLLASPVVHGVTVQFSSCVWYLRVSPDDTRGCQCPFLLCLHQKGYLQRGVRASGSYQERTRKSGSFGMRHHTRGYVSNFLMRRASC